MRTGIGLPAAIPEAPAGAVGEWAVAAEGSGRVVVERYFSLGADADETAHRYLHHYYGDSYVAAVVADTITTADRLERELGRLAAAGCDDVVLLPCDANIRQVELLAGALQRLRVSA